MHAMPDGVGVGPDAFRLRDVLIDPPTGLLDGPADRVRLEPRVMAVLVALARRHGELVPRQELLGAIWPGGEIYDDALTQAVYQLRQQLGQAGGAEYRELIKTVPKRGYLLEAAVQEVAPNGGESAGGHRVPLLAAGAAMLLACAALAVFLLAGKPVPMEAPADPIRVAVLPFLPLLEQQRDLALEHGIADTLITVLSGQGKFVVRPISSVRHFDEMDRDVLGTARALDVDAVVDGHLQHAGEALRVNVRLLRVPDGVALWAESFERPYADILALQDDIGRRIALALAPKLDDEPPRSTRPGATQNVEAYESYLKGRYHLARLTPDDLRTSLGHFRDAVAADPGYLQAWLGLANVSFRLPIAGEAPPAEHFAEARNAVERALEIDRYSAEAYSYLGWIEHWHDWDWIASEAHFRRALEMDPIDTEAHLGYAHLLSSTGRHEEALKEVRRARELSPFYQVAAALEGRFLMGAGRIEEAQRRAEEAVALDGDFWLTRVSLAGCYARQGRVDDALSELEIAQRLSGSTWAVVLQIALLARTGKRVEAEALLAELLERSSRRYVPPYDLAFAYAALGDGERAMAWLEQAWSLRDPKLALIGADRAAWAVLEPRPEFQDLLRRMNFPGATD